MTAFFDGFAASYFAVLGIYLVFGIAMGAISVLYGYARHGAIQFEAFLLVAILGTVGGLCGYLGGASRVGAVGDIVPAFIGLLAGLSAYFFGKESDHREIVAFSVLSFSVILFFGFAYGAKVRADAEFDQSFVDACQRLLFDPASYEVGNSLSARLLNRNDELMLMCESFFKAR